LPSFVRVDCDERKKNSLKLPRDEPSCPAAHPPPPLSLSLSRSLAISLRNLLALMMRATRADARLSAPKAQDEYSIECLLVADSLGQYLDSRRRVELTVLTFLKALPRAWRSLVPTGGEKKDPPFSIFNSPVASRGYYHSLLFSSPAGG